MKVCLLWLIAVSVAVATPQEGTVIQPADVKLGRPVDFNEDVLPILRSNCIACHNATTNENDLILETAAQAIQGGSEGAGIVPGKPEESLVYKVAARSAEPVMPPLPNDAKASALTPEQLGTLRQWIVEGARASAVKTKAITWRPVHDRLKAVYALGMHSPTGIIAASRADALDVYDMHSHEHLGRLVDPELSGPARAHRDVIQALAFHPSGRLFATGGYRTVKLWERTPLVEETVAVPGLTGPVVPLGDNRVALVAGNMEIRIFEELGGKPVATCSGHQSPVGAICGGKNETIVSADAGGSIRIWDQSGKQQAAIETGVAVHSLASHAEKICAGTEDGRILILNSSSPADPPTELKGHTARVSSLVGLSGDQLASGSIDGTARLWNLSEAKQLHSVNCGGPVACLATSPDGKHLAAGTETGRSVICEVGSGKQIGVCEADQQHALQLAGLNREKQIADRRVNFRTAQATAAKKEQETQEKTLKTAAEKVEASRKAVADARTKKDAEDSKLQEAKKELAAKAEDKAVKAKLDAVTASHKKLVDALAAAEKKLAAAIKDHDITARGVQRAKKVREDADARVASEQQRRTQVEAKLKELGALKPAASQAVWLSFASDQRLQTLHTDGTLRDWTLTGAPLRSRSCDQSLTAAAAVSDGILALAEGQLHRLGRKPAWRLAGRIEDSTLQGRVLALDFSHDGALLAVGSGQASRRGQIQLRDTKTWAVVLEINEPHSDTVLDLEFSPDDTRLLSCGADKFARVWNVADGSAVRSFEGHTHHVLSASWQPDMTHIATAGGDNVIKVWDADTGEQRRTISSYRKQVTGIQFVGPATTVLSCSGDQTVRAFTTDNGRNVRSFGGASGYLYAVAASPDEAWVIAGGEDGILRLWNGKDGKLLATLEPPK